MIFYDAKQNSSKSSYLTLSYNTHTCIKLQTLQYVNTSTVKIASTCIYFLRMICQQFCQDLKENYDKNVTIIVKQTECLNRSTASLKLSITGHGANETLQQIFSDINVIN